jgi:hypothetical protein
LKRLVGWPSAAPDNPSIRLSSPNNKLAYEVLLPDPPSFVLDPDFKTFALLMSVDRGFLCFLRLFRDALLLY